MKTDTLVIPLCLHELKEVKTFSALGILAKILMLTPTKESYTFCSLTYLGECVKLNKRSTHRVIQELITDGLVENVELQDRPKSDQFLHLRVTKKVRDLFVVEDEAKTRMEEYLKAHKVDKKAIEDAGLDIEDMMENVLNIKKGKKKTVVKQTADSPSDSNTKTTENPSPAAPSDDSAKTVTDKQTASPADTPSDGSTKTTDERPDTPSENSTTTVNNSENERQKKLDSYIKQQGWTNLFKMKEPLTIEQYDLLWDKVKGKQEDLDKCMRQLHTQLNDPNKFNRYKHQTVYDELCMFIDNLN